MVPTPVVHQCLIPMELLTNIMIMCALLPVLVSADFSYEGTPVDDLVIEGDLMLGALLTLDYSLPGKVCRAGRNHFGVQQYEAIKFTINKVNKNNSVLPNTTLGAVFLSVCARNSITGGRAAQLIHSTGCFRGACTDYNASYAGVHPSYDVVGVIGPVTSSQTSHSSGLLSHYRIPHISAGATSEELSNKVDYEYFSRVTPSDVYQAKAMVDVMVHFNWTYISILAIEGSYGRDGKNKLMQFTKEKGICVASSLLIPYEFTDDQYDDAVKTLHADTRSRVLALFVYKRMLEALFQSLKRLKLIGEIMIISSESFTYINVKSSYVFPGIFAISLVNSRALDFEAYYETQPAMHLNGQSRWVGLYTDEDLECEWLQGNETSSKKNCHEYDNMTAVGTPGFQYMPLLPHWMDVVGTFVVSLDNLIRKECPEAFGKREDLKECVKGPLLLSYIRNVTFDGYVQPIKFDEYGDLEGGYDLIQLQDDKGEFGNVKVGTWDRESGIHVHNDLVKWYSKDDKQLLSVTDEAWQSVCAIPCGKGEFYIQGELPCCWECQRCRDNEILSKDHQGCESCMEFTWPDQINFTTCEYLLPNCMMWDDSLAIGLESMCALGIFTALWITIIFIRNRGRKVIKGSSVQLMTSIILGIFLAYLIVLFNLMKPEDWNCYLNYFVYHLSGTLIFAPLLLKTIRLYRIFKAADKLQVKIKLVTTASQIGLLIFITIIQVRH